MHHHPPVLSHLQHRSSLHFAGLLLLIVLLAACAGPGTKNQTSQVSPTAGRPGNGFTPFKLGLPAEALNAPVTGPLPDTTSMHVGVTFKINQVVFEKLKKAGKGTNLEEGAKDLGISDALYQKIKDFFGVTGARLTLDGLHIYLTLDAPARTVAQVFQVSFVQHTLKGRTFFTPSTDPKIPNFLYPSILALTGLDNFTPPPTLQGRLTPTARLQTAAQSSPAFCAPAVLLQTVAHIYGYDQLWQQGWKGEGMTINFIEFGPINMQDLKTFGACVHFHGSIKTIDVAGGPDPHNASDVNAGGEATLDVEMAQALAPAATIKDYQTGYGNPNGMDSWTHLNDMLHQIIADNERSTPAGSVLSISYGSAEQYLSQSMRQAYDQSLSIMTNLEHMTVFVASGDCGAFDSEQWGTLAVDYPASSPYAVAVGGTQLLPTLTGDRFSEQVWSDASDKTTCQNSWGSGGGNSLIASKPDWQSAPGVQNRYSQGQRQLPDLSAVAFGLPIYYQGQWAPSGGTSAAAPIWAAGFMLVNQAVIQRARQFYYAPDTFYTVIKDTHRYPYYDVTEGNNGYFPATSGWDYATGLGAPSLVQLTQALLSTANRSGS